MGAFDGGLNTSNAGALLLGATSKAIRLADHFAGCLATSAVPGTRSRRLWASARSIWRRASSRSAPARWRRGTGHGPTGMSFGLRRSAASILLDAIGGRTINVALPAPAAPA